jgi:hypothetical protein
MGKSTMRNQAFILAFLVAASGLPMMAQQTVVTIPSLERGSPVVPVRSTAIDWNGTWQTEIGGLLNSRVVEISIRQTESAIFVKDMNDGRDFLKIILEASYLGRDSFAGTLYPGASYATKVTLTSKDPDTIVMTPEPGFTYHRHSPPALNDIPCSTSNPLHVSADGAIAREKVALAAKADVPTACWSYIAALTGDTYSLYAAGYLLRRGIGAEKDLTLAFHFMEHSAFQGNYQAQLEAAEMAERGEGEAASPVLAQRFREMARMQVAAQQLGKLMEVDDRINKGLKDIFGPAYPGDECGISYDFYANWRRTNPNAKSPCDNPELRRRYGSK